MSNDCEQCREWELCPFHPKEKPAPEPAHDDEWANVPCIDRRDDLSANLSPCGRYVHTYRGDKLVDEEPVEAYTYTMTGVSLMHCGGGGISANSATVVASGGNGGAGGRECRLTEASIARTRNIAPLPMGNGAHTSLPRWDG